MIILRWLSYYGRFSKPICGGGETGRVGNFFTQGGRTDRGQNVSLCPERARSVLLAVGSLLTFGRLRTRGVCFSGTHLCNATHLRDQFEPGTRYQISKRPNGRRYCERWPIKLRWRGTSSRLRVHFLPDGITTTLLNKRNSILIGRVDCFHYAISPNRTRAERLSVWSWARTVLPFEGGIPLPAFHKRRE